jgi:two-component system, NtrC family, sensor kinase
MVAGIVGGHVMLLFSVAFLRTESKMVFRAWWEIIPALAILGTLGFTLAVRPTTDKVIAALRLGPSTDNRPLLLAGLAQATAIPRTLTLINFSVWLICTSIGIVYFQPGPQKWQWADAVMQIAFGALFAWGVSFYQRSWHEQTVAPVIARLRAWTDTVEEREEMSLRQRMLNEFGLPLLFTLTLSLFASIGLYRTLGNTLTLREDFNAITALSASFVMLVLAVGSVFMRAARQLSDPLSRLARAADRVASGKLDAEVPLVTGPNEVVGLGLSIEHMRRALARTIAELKEERAGLETNVEMRTAELRRALEELKQAQTALIQGERMALIGELVASVAHEIHNPLNAIGGSVSSLERVASELNEMVAAYRESEALLPAEERRKLEDKRKSLDIDGALGDLAGIVKVVQSATRRSVEIVANLQSFSRATAEPIPVDLHAGLSETLSLLRHKLRQREIRVVEEYSELGSVVCRAGEINQVFMNLLTNAIQAVEKGGGVIQVATRREDDFAVVRISDNGAGVPGALRDKVFDPFFTTKQRGEGTGLGLSISREIVRRHGGTLTMEDGDGGGACFVCRLPVAGPEQSVRAHRTRPEDRRHI